MKTGSVSKPYFKVISTLTEIANLSTNYFVLKRFTLMRVETRATRLISRIISSYWPTNYGKITSVQNGSSKIYRTTLVEMQQARSMVTALLEIQQAGSTVTTLLEIQQAGSTVTTLLEIQQAGSTVTTLLEIQLAGSTVTKLLEIQQKGPR